MSLISRPPTPVKIKSTGAFDLHFHGAFGIDLMRAETAELDTLCARLLERGVGGFCATTISAPERTLLPAVARLGRWIKDRKRRVRVNHAVPLGIHLEGPFLNPRSAGAHPPGVLRPATLSELEELWKESAGTLKIITLAPEIHAPKRLAEIVKWCRSKNILPSLGHSRATESQSLGAFLLGFRGVTHAWNALPFHHREPGALGAARQCPKIYLELIADGVHVAPEVVRWTIDTFPDQVCLVSDCAPAAATSGKAWHPFGPIRCRFFQGASRLPGGALAGGGVLLSEAFLRLFDPKKDLALIQDRPLRILGISRQKQKALLRNWKLDSRGRWTLLN